MRDTRLQVHARREAGSQQIVPAALLGGSVNVKTLTFPTEVPMCDPRWGDDPRDRDDNSRDLSRGSRGGADPRDRERVDPRDVFMEHVNLPPASNESTFTTTATITPCAAPKRAR